MRGVHVDLHIQHGGQATQALGAYAQRIDLLEQLQAQLFHLIELGTAGCLLLQLVHVEVFHQAFLGQQHGFFSGAANADAQHARWAPARTHGRHGLEHPVDDVVAGVHHDHLGLVLRAAALGSHGHIQLVARHDLHIDDGRRVVLGVLAGELRVGHHRGTQGVVGVVVATAHAFVDGVFEAHREVFPLDIHAHLQEHVDDAGVLADGTLAGRAHLGVGQDLGHRILGRRALLALVGPCQVLDEIRCVVVADVLQGARDRVDQVLLTDGGGHRACGVGFGLRKAMVPLALGITAAIIGLSPGRWWQMPDKSSRRLRCRSGVGLRYEHARSMAARRR